MDANEHLALADLGLADILCARTSAEPYLS